MTVDPLMHITHALLHPEAALAAVEALRGKEDRAAIEGLVEHLSNAGVARTAIAALSALDGCTDAIVLDGLAVALGSAQTSVRLAAVQAARKHASSRLREDLLRLLEQDESRLVRSAALEALAETATEERWQVMIAATDPHWRVRHTLLRVLLRWGEHESERRPIEQRLQGEHARIRGLRAYLLYRWKDRQPSEEDLAAEPDAFAASPVWDWDAAVLHRNLERLGMAGRRQALATMPGLLVHADARVSTMALETLRHAGQPQHLAAAIALLDDPRLGSAAPVGRLLGYLDLDRSEAVAAAILAMPAPSPAQLAWAVDQIEVALSAADVAAQLSELERSLPACPAPVRRAFARLLGRWTPPQARGRLHELLADESPAVQADALRQLHQLNESIPLAILELLQASPAAAVRIEAARAAGRQQAPSLWQTAGADPDARVRQALAEQLAARGDGEHAPFLARLQADPHPHVRAAALTPAAARRLVAEPAAEASWHVLGRAADLAQVPFFRLEPEEPWRPPERPSVVAPLLSVQRSPPPQRCWLGPARLEVSRVGVSGHYGLPVEGFVRALESGVNLFIWEPNYQTLTELCARLSSAERRKLHFIAGTFEATGRRVQRDVEHALRTLQIEQIALFLVFWVQSWQRISEDVRDTLERLQTAGKLGTYSLSTHSRPLALEAIDAGWNPVMVRHSAAHRGAEKEVFPRAQSRGTSLITFNNTCYGRLLKPQPGLPPPSAADCYRYTLSHSAVTLCLSAPATLEQLEDNLAALRDPELPPERRAALLAQGARVYREDTLFRQLIRSR